jgi:hypothetical protein
LDLVVWVWLGGEDLAEEEVWKDIFAGDGRRPKKNRKRLWPNIKRL